MMGMVKVAPVHPYTFVVMALLMICGVAAAF